MPGFYCQICQMYNKLLYMYTNMPFEKLWNASIFLTVDELWPNAKHDEQKMVLVLLILSFLQSAWKCMPSNLKVLLRCFCFWVVVDHLDTSVCMKRVIALTRYYCNLKTTLVDYVTLFICAKVYLFHFLQSLLVSNLLSTATECLQ